MAYIIREDYSNKLGKTEIRFLPDDLKQLNEFFAQSQAYPGSVARATWVSGTWLPPEVMPSRLRLQRGKPAYDWMASDGGLVISPRFKDAVEELDPGRHQFFPVTIEDKKGDVVPGEFFLFNIVGRIDSIIEERSNLKPVGRGVSEAWYYTRKVGPWQCALDQRVIDGRAGWVEERYDQSWFVSDRLAELLRERKMTGFSLDEHSDEIMP